MIKESLFMKLRNKNKYYLLAHMLFLNRLSQSTSFNLYFQIRNNTRDNKFLKLSLN